MSQYLKEVIKLDFARAHSCTLRPPLLYSERLQSNQLRESVAVEPPKNMY